MSEAIESPAQIVIIRAIPPHGFKTRMRAGKRWTATPQPVRVVDAPGVCPQCKDKKKINGVPCVLCGGSGKAPDEITPSQLVEIQNDPHMAWIFQDAANADAEAANAAKANVVKLTADLVEVRRELEAHKELLAAAQFRHKEDAERLGAEVQRLMVDLETARAAIGKRRERQGV